MCIGDSSTQEEILQGSLTAKEARALYYSTRDHCEDGNRGEDDIGSLIEAYGGDHELYSDHGTYEPSLNSDRMDIDSDHESCELHPEDVVYELQWDDHDYESDPNYAGFEFEMDRTLSDSESGDATVELDSFSSEAIHTIPGGVDKGEKIFDFKQSWLRTQAFICH